MVYASVVLEPRHISLLKFQNDLFFNYFILQEVYASVVQITEA